MKDYASKSDYKYNPNAEFYTHNYCVAFDFSKSGVKAADFVGRKISGEELIGTPVSNIDECGIPCFTIYTTPRLEYSREGEVFNMNTYRVINFAYPADDGNGYPYYLIKPIIGERCKVSGTYNSSKGGFYDSSLGYTVKIRGVKDLENNKTYTLEGIIRYVTTSSSYTDGEYIFDVTGDISFDYEISKQPTEDDLTVELNKPNTQASYQWYQLEEVPNCDVTVDFEPTSYNDGWRNIGYGRWSATSSNNDMRFSKYIEIEKGDTLCFDWETPIGGKLEFYMLTSNSYLWDYSNMEQINGYNKYKGKFTKILQTEGSTLFGIKFKYGDYYNSGDAIISNIVIKKKNKVTKNIGSVLEKASSSILSEEQFIDGKSVYCVVTLPHGQKLVSDTIQTRENFIAKQPTDRDLSVELRMPTDKATYQWYKVVDAELAEVVGIEGATRTVLDKFKKLKVGDVVFCEVTLPNGRVLRSERVTLDEKSFPGDGDVNCDGRLTVTDVTHTVGYNMGTLAENNTFEAELADIDKDGMVIVPDLTAIVDLVLKADYMTNAMARAPHKERTAALSVFDIVQNMEGGETSIDISVTSGFIATQFDLILPEGAILGNANLEGKNAETHKMTYRRMDDNRIRVIIFSMNNAEMSDNIVGLTLQFDGEGEVLLTNALVNEMQADGHITEKTVADVCANVSGSVTNIKNMDDCIKIFAEQGEVVIETDKEQTVTIISISGLSRKINAGVGSTRIALPAGVYIVNGKKIIIR